MDHPSPAWELLPNTKDQDNPLQIAMRAATNTGVTRMPRSLKRLGQLSRRKWLAKVQEMKVSKTGQMMARQRWKGQIQDRKYRSVSWQIVDRTE